MVIPTASFANTTLSIPERRVSLGCAHWAANPTFGTSVPAQSVRIAVRDPKALVRRSPPLCRQIRQGLVPAGAGRGWQGQPSREGAGDGIRRGLHWSCRIRASWCGCWVELARNIRPRRDPASGGPISASRMDRRSRVAVARPQDAETRQRSLDGKHRPVCCSVWQVRAGSWISAPV